MIRSAAVAGRFYEGTESGLRAHIARLVDEGAERVVAKAVLVPHAGIMYSGGVAGAVYSRIVFPETFVFLGPNHTGMGAAVAMMPEGRWETPMGCVEIDAPLAEAIAREAPLVSPDIEAHMMEHSIEVQLPFVRHFSGTARIVPIAVMSAALDELKDIGRGIARAVRAAGYPVVVAISSDMSHFIPEKEARKKDGLALDRVLALDPGGLYETVRARGIGFLLSGRVLSANKTLPESVNPHIA